MDSFVNKERRDRKEIYEVIGRSKLDKDLKKSLLKFAEELENGRLKKLIDEVNAKI